MIRPAQALAAVVLAALMAVVLGLRATDKEPITLTCVGDIMLGRDVAQACEEHGSTWPLAEVAAELARADLTLGNLECPLTDVRTRMPRVNSLRASPDMARVLAEAGFDVLGLANNHAADYGRPGLTETLSALEEAGITPIGAGRTLQKAKAGRVVTVRGLRVGFAGFSNFPYVNFVHDPPRAGISMLSEEALRECLPPLARRCDVLVVSFHWGKEGSRAVSDFERRTAHLAVDLGADLVVGHHAHVRGEIERYRGALICYCLGNLVFDQHSWGGNEGYILHCEVSRSGVESFEALPVEVVDCRARYTLPGVVSSLESRDPLRGQGPQPHPAAPAPHHPATP